MPNRNYIKGRRKEYKIVNEAKAKGLLAFRSAGSHSPIDIVVIDKDNRTIKFIQSKPESMSENMKQSIINDNKQLNNVFVCSFVVE